MTVGVRPNKKTVAPLPVEVRVAIYTRKSVTEGLDQEFNTLDAQRDSAEAYIKSQRGQGWTTLQDRYDDGGFTGANVDRPAFKRLLADIEAGQVDVVAVYKIDRLSRSLLDFAKLMEFFQAHGVAFVSVTETFDTSTPMGRMVLNLLATFAQFERETTAQRTRDKMIASRRRGMWTGGRPVLGYDVEEKRLVVNNEEAERVRAIFMLYLELGGLLPVVEETKMRGWTTKTWANKRGELVRGRPFTKTSLNHMLRNPLYAGRVKAGDEVHAGVHDAIIDEETWDAVQARLSEHGQRTQPRRSRSAALLGGLVRCAVCGAGMTHSASRKGSKRYAYYVCQTAQKQGAKACPGSRISAGDLETFVLDHVREIGRDPKVIEATLEADRQAQELRRPELAAESRRLGAERARLDSERSALVDAITKGGKAAPALAERLGERDEELRAVERRREAVREELAALSTGTIDADELQEALADLEPLWAELFPAERSRILALLLERIEFDGAGGEVAITFRPGGPAMLTTS